MAEELHKHAEMEMLGDLLDDDATPEELDAAVEQDTEKPKEAAQPDTEQETGEPDTDAETGGEEETPDFAAEWSQTEIGKRYRTPAEADRAFREAQAYIGRLTNQVYNQPQQQPSPRQVEELPTVDADSFLNDPHGSIKRMSLVSKNEAAQIASDAITHALEEERLRQFHERTPDLDKYRVKMAEIVQRYPGFETMPRSQAYAVLYDLAKAQEPKKPKVEVVPSDQAKKERAKTSGGRSAPGAKRTAADLTPEDYARLSPEKIEEIVGFGDE